MKNIAKTIKDFIAEKYPSITFYFDTFPDADTDGVLIIHDPSARKTAEYIDGTTVYNINISFTIRSTTASTARGTLDNILTLIDKQKITDSADGLQLKINTVSNIQFVGTDDKNRTIYTCSASVEYKDTIF